MSKKAITILFLSAAISTAKAQSDAPFDKGTNVISASIGLGGHFGIGTYGSQTPGISIQYERGIWEIGGPGIISLGGYIGFKSYKYTNTYSDYYLDNNFNMIPFSHTVTQKWNYTIVGVRSAYHWTGINSDKFDVYGGLMISDNILSYKYDDNDPGYSGIYDEIYGSYGSFIQLSAFVGGRYFFTSKFAGFAELGYGVAYLNLGVALKF